jgi:dihydropteroate synthase
MLVRMVAHAGGRLIPARTALVAVAADLSDACAAVEAGADLIDVSYGGLGQAGSRAAEDETIAALRARHPGVGVCATGGTADLVRDPAVALATGALLICADPGVARASVLPASRLVVEVTPDAANAAAAAGWAALADADRSAALADADRTAGWAALADADRTASWAALVDADRWAALADADRTAGWATDPDLDDADDDAMAAGAAGAVAIAAVCSWLGVAAVRTRHPLQVRRALDMAASIQGTRPPARTVRGLA